MSDADDSEQMEVVFTFPSNEAASMFTFGMVILVDMRPGFQVTLDGNTVELAGDAEFLTWVYGQVTLRASELGCNFNSGSERDIAEC